MSIPDGHQVIEFNDYQTWKDGYLHCHRCDRQFAWSNPELELRCCKRDGAKPKPAAPVSMLTKAYFAANALKDFVFDGCKTVTEEQYKERLNICGDCEHRCNNTCTKCGCRLSLKARGRVFQCPEDRWPIIEE